MNFVRSFLLIVGCFGVLAVHADESSRRCRLGVLLPLSGPVAEMGQAGLKGLELYRHEHPEFEKVVEVVVEDHKYDGKTTSVAAQKLISVSKADILYVWGNQPSDVVAPIAKRHNTPTFYGSSNSYGSGSASVVELGAPFEAAAPLVAKWLTAEGANAGAYVTLDIGNAISFVDEVDKELGYPLLREIISADTSDFRSMLIRLKKRDIKRVFLIALVVPSLKLISQAKELGMELAYVGGDIHASEEFKKGAQDLGVTPDIVATELQDDFVTRLKDVVKQRSYLGEAALGYAVAQMVHRLSPQCGGLSKGEFSRIVSESVELSTLPQMYASMSGTRIAFPWKIRSLAEY